MEQAYKRPLVEPGVAQFILLAPYTTLHCIGIGVTFLIIMIGHRAKMSHKTDLFITQGGGKAADKYNTGLVKKETDSLVMFGHLFEQRYVCNH